MATSMHFFSFLSELHHAVMTSLFWTGQVLDDVMVHITDWYPTLLSAAGIEVGYHRSTKLYGSEETDTRFDDVEYGTIPLDGMDLWSAIQFGDVAESISLEKREILLDLDGHHWNCTFSTCGALRKGHWKFIRGANMVRSTKLTEGHDWQRHDASSCLFFE